MKCALLLLSLISLNCFASVNDVESTGKKFVKVSIQDEYVKFELCNKETKNCDILGNREYTKTELKNLHTKLAAELGGSAIVSTIGLVGAGVGIIMGGGAIVLATADGVIGYTLAGGMLTGGAGAIVLGITSKYNPVNLYKRMDTVKKEIVNDKLVTISGGDVAIAKFAATLSDTLSEI